MSLTRVVRRGRKVGISAWERAVVFRDGIMSRTVDAGRHTRGRREEWWVLDVRPRRVVVPTQEVLTGDGVQIRVSVFAKYSIVDPAAWITAAMESDAELHALVQLELRGSVAKLTLEELIAGRQALLEDSVETTAQAGRLGIELESLDVRDLTLSQELRRAFAETVLAREAGKARLERARSEAAALRSLANSALLLEKHPSLIHLRAVEAVEGGSGSQLVLRLGDAPATS